MKLELDLSSVESLQKQRKQFESAIRVIDAALKEYDNISPIRAASVESLLTAINGEIEKAYDNLPEVFSASVLYAQANRDEAKAFIRKRIEGGKLKVLQPGAGRKATVYQKINQ